MPRRKLQPGAFVGDETTVVQETEETLARLEAQRTAPVSPGPSVAEEPDPDDPAASALRQAAERKATLLEEIQVLQRRLAALREGKDPDQPITPVTWTMPPLRSPTGTRRECIRVQNRDFIPGQVYTTDPMLKQTVLSMVGMFEEIERLNLVDRGSKEYLGHVDY